MSYIRRAGEPCYLEPFDRQQRLFCNENGYFYKTRECSMIGPFESIKEAQTDLKLFVEINQIDKEIHTMIC